MLTRRQLIASGAGALLVSVPSLSAAQEASELQINSARYISINADTGAIFAQRGARDEVAIASITKVFTAVEAVNLAPLDYQITTTEDDMQPAEASIMGFGPGETFTLEELLYGMLLPSGNDAAYAIARSLGAQEGDSAEEAVQRFVDLVNQRVQLMGLTNTHLVNPHGWGVPDHYSSAADVAAFMAYASENEFVLNAIGTTSYTTSAGYTLTNNNRVLSTSPSVLGGKTGYDWDSGWCLVQIAERNNTRIVAVTLDGIAPDDWYNDNLVLLDYGFDEQTALGTEAFEGESVTWSDPAPKLFAQSGPAEASITGESVSGELLTTTERVEAPPIRIAPEVQAPVVEFDGERSSTGLAGIGATVLAAGMAASRWIDFGGDRTFATLQPSLAASAGSIKRALPSLPKRTRQDNPEPPKKMSAEESNETDAAMKSGVTRPFEPQQ